MNPTCYWCNEPADLLYTKTYHDTIEDDRGGIGCTEWTEDVPLCVECYREEVESQETRNEQVAEPFRSLLNGISGGVK
jgi:hypothetical protein